MTRDLTELNKLEEYLKTNEIPYERKDNDWFPLDFHQIIVYNEEGKVMWDAVCHHGSYGVEKGLLEVMGNIVDQEIHEDGVEGWLTAEDIIKRIEK